MQEKDDAASRCSSLGVNHLLRAINNEQANEKKEEQRRMGQNMSIERQNEMFPNNLEHKLK